MRSQGEKNAKNGDSPCAGGGHNLPLLPMASSVAIVVDRALPSHSANDPPRKLATAVGGAKFEQRKFPPAKAKNFQKGNSCRGQFSFQTSKRFVFCRVFVV